MEYKVRELGWEVSYGLGSDNRITIHPNWYDDYDLACISVSEYELPVQKEDCEILLEYLPKLMKLKGWA